jgi:hypothetical protein
MASDPTTWAELKASLAEWLNRTDLTAKIPELIALAERRFNRKLFVPERETAATLTINAASIALPADFWALRGIYLDSDPIVQMQPVTLAALRDGYSNSGKPLVYAISAENIVFGPVPDGTYSAKITYYATIPALGASVATNWLLTDHPDIYLYGSLLMAEAYLWNDPRLGLWKAALDEAMAELTEAGNRKRYSAQPMRLRSPVSY